MRERAHARTLAAERGPCQRDVVNALALLLMIPAASAGFLSFDLERERVVEDLRFAGCTDEASYVERPELERADAPNIAIVAPPVC